MRSRKLGILAVVSLVIAVSLSSGYFRILGFHYTTKHTSYDLEL